jgi:PAS domain S-box-containing protein
MLDKKFAQTILSSLESIIYVVDESDNIIYCNQPFVKLFRDVNLIGKNLNDFIDASDIDKIKATNKIAVKKGLYSGEEIITLPNSLKKNFFASKSPLKSNGEIIGVTVNLIDIANYNKSQQTHIAELDNIILEEQNRFRQIIDAVDVSIYCIDIVGRLIYCNQYVVDMFGKKSRNEIIGKNEYDLIASGEVAKKIATINSIVLKDGHYHGEESGISSDGKSKTFLTSKSRLLNSNGETIGIVGVSVDITAEKDAEILRVKNIKNEEKLAAQAVFKDLIDSILSTLHRAQIKLSSSGDMEHKLKNSLNNNIKLSKREQEILYYLSINKSPKEISTIIGKKENKSLSPATILSIICKQLYIKFDVNSTSTLIEKAKLLDMVPFVLDNFSNSD